ncbi:MAG TPA: hypothetical protein EYO58_09085, partial [Flavobacteriales bacterium]|nr:hypothetical protein [Flavobacteriales bacterium]
HNFYDYIGIDNLTRTIVHLKPNRFIILDFIETQEGHTFKQQFNFHPIFDIFQQIDEQSMVVKSSHENMPSLYMTFHEKPLKISTLRGVHTASEVQGWYFKKFNTKQAATTVQAQYKEKNGKVSLPVYIELLPPSSMTPLKPKLSITAQHHQVKLEIESPLFHKELMLPRTPRNRHAN